MKYRSVNRECLNCGGQIPNKVEREENDGYIRYTCPKCGSLILRGLISEGGNPVQIPRGEETPPTHPDFYISSGTDWDTIEQWWTDGMNVYIIHGKTSEGNTELADFVEKIKYIYDHSS